MKTDEKTKAAPDVVKSDFAATLAEVNKGRSPFELSQALDKLVRAVRETGKPGKLVYTLTINPVPKTESQVGVTDDIDIKLPKPNRFQSLFFTTKDNRLSRENPDQMQIPNID